MDKPKIPTLEQVSAGGVAFRRLENQEIRIAVVSVKPRLRWQLPKGIVDAGESEEQAALREVREEAGLECRIIEKIETVEYWYFAAQKGERVRFHKFVHFFLLEYLSGDVRDHDREIAEARWTSVDEAARLLAFKSEKQVVRKAADLMTKPANQLLETEN